MESFPETQELGGWADREKARLQPMHSNCIVYLDYLLDLRISNFLDPGSFALVNMSV
jgi:hypothetical protein